MAVKDAILKALMEDILVDLFVRTGVENVVMTDGGEEKTLAVKLTEIIRALNDKATVAALTSGLEEKAEKTHAHALTDITGLSAELNGRPTSAEMNAAISTAINNLIDGAPAAYDTLKEIADYLATHENEYTALTSAVGSKLDQSVYEAFVKTIGDLARKDKITQADLDAELAEKVAEASEKNHSHTNQGILDGITATKTGNWDKAYTHSQTVHAPSDAQVNKIDNIKLNGAVQEIKDKTVDLEVPHIYVQEVEPELGENDLWFQIVEE